MRKEFIGYFKRPPSEVKAIWKTATFVFDANVLLNLYRYSEVTRNDFLNLFKKVKDRIWLPEQVGYEFLNNRASVISEQSKAYADAIKSVESLAKSLSEERTHPFISTKVKTEYEQAAEAIKAEMSENQEAQEKLLTEDPIRDQIADLFEGKVGAAYTADEMSNVFKNGEARYSENMPPGYKDEKKFKTPKNETEKRSNYGDWILWRQLMDFAKASKKPVVFVTNDTKEDWWLEQSGKTLGPRPELIAEFFTQTQQHILIYKPERFLDLGNENLHAEIDKNSIAEVSSERESRERDKNRLKHILMEKKLSSETIKNRRVFPLYENDNPTTNDWRPASEEMEEWRLSFLRDRLDEIQADLERLDVRIEHLHVLFSEAVEVGDHGRISEIEGLLKSAWVEKAVLEKQLFALREGYRSDLKS